MLFTKMQGLGNDYIYFYTDKVPDNIEDMSVRLSDRHFGIGSDGIILILPSEKADFMMRIYNADGSEAKMCGNGIRCVGKYVYDKHYTDKETLLVDTLSGIKTLHMTADNGRIKSVSVDMGKAVVGDENKITVLKHLITYIPVSVGNPHAVVVCGDAEFAPLDTIGKAMERHEQFPGGVNVEFVSSLGENKLRMRVWERGSGITMACGTGACATVAAACSAGLAKYGVETEVVLDGGSLFITVQENGDVIMRGPAEIAFEGEI